VISGERGMTTIQYHLTLVWKTTESDTVTTYPASRETGDETKEEALATRFAPLMEGKPLVLL
jgi:hypothetical protein